MAEFLASLSITLVVVEIVYAMRAVRSYPVEPDTRSPALLKACCPYADVAALVADAPKMPSLQRLQRSAMLARGSGPTARAAGRPSRSML